MYGQSGSYGILEPNVTRLIEETVNSIEDVERRLTGLKLGIAQTFPQLAPILQAREVQHRDQNAIVLARIGISPVAVSALAPGLLPFPPTPAGLGSLASVAGFPSVPGVPITAMPGLSPFATAGSLVPGLLPTMTPGVLGNAFLSPIQGGVTPLGSPFRLW